MLENVNQLRVGDECVGRTRWRLKDAHNLAGIGGLLSANHEDVSSRSREIQSKLDGFISMVTAALSQWQSELPSMVTTLPTIQL